jgi:deferrochelatase/peroxidase EfeB
MSASDNKAPVASRRSFLTGAAGLAGAAGALAAAGAASTTAAAAPKGQIEPFWGPHQGGVITPAQTSTYFAAFDLIATRREDVAAMLRAWTEAAARMTAGQTAVPLGADAAAPAADTGEVVGLPAARLTVTFGFGAGLFSKDGEDRYGLAHRRPEALIDLPRFNGDQLVPERTGGDLSVQACADDPQVAFHAVRQLARLADGVARLRWAQPGFVAGYAPGQTPRNLMGFKDGTMNPLVSDTRLMDQFVWVGDEGGDWMRGGSYVVARPARIALEHWDRMTLAFQEQTMGRKKDTGAAPGKVHEFDPIDLDAVDADGNPLIAENAHVRLGAPAANDGAQILRRSYSYDNGLSFVAERWPPWRQGMEFDAGLLFVCYQRDPRTGFVKIFETMSKFDMMNQFVTHIGGGLFACPGGAAKGEYIGQRLFQAV